MNIRKLTQEAKLDDKGKETAERHALFPLRAKFGARVAYCRAPNSPVSCSAMDAITYAGAARTRVWPRRLAWTAGSLLGLVVLFLAGTNLYVIYGPHGSYTSNVERVP